MKNILFILSFAILGILSSCGYEETGDWMQPEFKHIIPPQYGQITMNFSSSSSSSSSSDYRNFSMTAEMTALINEPMKYWNLRIDKVDYYLDEQLIDSCTEEPYKVSYSHKTYPKGSHKIKAVLYFTGPHYDGEKVERTRTFEVK